MSKFLVFSRQGSFLGHFPGAVGTLYIEKSNSLKEKKQWENGISGCVWPGVLSPPRRWPGERPDYLFHVREDANRGRYLEECTGGGFDMAYWLVTS